jgi:transcriptional regulator with XRE-family HTH domain
MTSFDVELGRLATELAEAMDQRGMTSEDLSRLSGVSSQTIRKYLKGAPPSPAKWRKVQAALYTAPIPDPSTEHEELRLEIEALRQQVAWLRAEVDRLARRHL